MDENKKENYIQGVQSWLQAKSTLLAFRARMYACSNSDHAKSYHVPFWYAGRACHAR